MDQVETTLRIKIFDLLFPWAVKDTRDQQFNDFMRQLGLEVGYVVDHLHTPYTDPNRSHLKECQRCNKGKEVHRYIPSIRKWTPSD